LVIFLTEIFQRSRNGHAKVTANNNEKTRDCHFVTIVTFEAPHYFRVLAFESDPPGSMGKAVAGIGGRE